MAHFAQLDENNIVLQVVKVSNAEMYDGSGNEVEEFGVALLKKIYGGTTNWKQTSYNAKNGKYINSETGEEIVGKIPLRKTYAGVGYTYSPVKDAFIPICPHNGWVFNESTWEWDPPNGYPADVFERPAGVYTWNEETLQWDENT